MSDMKYEVDDKVRIKTKFHFCSVDEFNNINMKDEFFNQYSRLTYCENVMTIGIVNKDYYVLKEDKFAYKWTDDMIECKVEEETKPKFNVGDRVITDTNMTGKIIEVVEEGWYRVEFEPYHGIPQPNSVVPEKHMSLVEEENNYCEKCGLTPNSIRCLFMDKCPYNKQKTIIEIPENYIIKDENGDEILTSKIILEKKQEYPKTYEDCAEIIVELTGSDCNPKGCMGYMSAQLTALQKLFICRDAYWKIAGDKLGLRKPWEPDWREERYIIYRNQDDIIGGYRAAGHVEHHIFEFPIIELRDAFRENFGPDLEICKDFL